MIRILEQYIRSKLVGSDLSTCEDALVVTNDYVAVIDGATSTSSRRWTDAELTAGQWAARILVQGLQEETEDASPSPSDTRSTRHSCRSPKELVDALTQRMKQAYQEQGVLQLMEEQPHQRATASMFLYSRALHQLIAVGDCQAALMDSHGKIFQVIQPGKYNDQVMAAARAMFLQLEIVKTRISSKQHDKDKQKNHAHHTAEEDLRHLASDPGRDFIEPLRVGQRLFQNNLDAPKPYQYWVMDGFSVDETHGIQVYDLPQQTRQIILATDGYLRLDTTLAKTEAHLRYVIDNDPLLIRGLWQGTKGVRPGAESFDDRTYVRFSVERPPHKLLVLAVQSLVAQKTSVLAGILAATLVAAVTTAFRIRARGR